MRLSTPTIFTGSLGQLAQVLINAVNYLRVAVQGASDAETDAGNAMMGFAQSGALAANVSQVQLMNPAASGKSLYVDSLTVDETGSSNDAYTVALFNTALATNVATVSNKNSGGAAPVGQIRTSNNATPQGTLIYNLFGGTSTTLTFKPPIKLSQGQGVVVAGGTVNRTVNASYQWREY